MAESVLVLKKRAVKAGMDKKAAMKASRGELEEFLSGGGKPKGAAKKKAVAKKKGAAKKSTTKTTSKKSTKKTSTKKANSKASKSKAPKGNGDGRHMVGSLDFTDTDGWNPREGSPVALIFKALKKRKGDVDKTTDDLLPNAKEYVSLRKANGDKRTKDEIRNLLRYRVNRTKWEFARRTGQHEPSENRVEYGTGDYAQKNGRKSSKKSTTKTKTNSKKSSAKSKKATKSKKKTKK